MTLSPHLSRRQLLQGLAAAPLLPLCTGAAAATGEPAAAGPASGYRATRFVSMAAPTLADPAAMATTTVASMLEVSYQDGSTQQFRLAYQPFFLTGDRVPDGQGGTVVAGGYFNSQNQPIIDRSVPGRERQMFSDCPDGMSLLQLPQARVAGVRGHTVFAVVQFEYTSRAQGPMPGNLALPSPMAVLTLDQDPATGQLSLVKYHNVDTSGVHGLWVTCGASLSPWGTHLSSEEYEPDAQAPASGYFKSFSRHQFGSETAANPYHYGHLPEVTVHADGTGSIEKHFCLGRISHELVQVMPDRRTVLMGDDTTNGGLFMFIADQATRLSAGTLYAARWHQTSGLGPGSATLDWVRLGHASSAEIRALADRLQPADILDVKTADPQAARYTRIRHAGKDNWVALQPGMAQAAAFLETHRYAALMGASLGFTKMESTTVNARDKVAYTAMSYIQTSMVDGSTDIRVQGPKAGAVYAMNLQGGRKDTAGTPIDSAWVPVDMAAPPALVGEDLATPDALGNLAHAGRIANPDNLKFSEKMRTLFIGEDSSGHVNNFLWAYNVDTKELARLLSCPAGAEATGLQSVDDLNGWTYITSNFQHPGAWSSPLHDQVRATLDPLVRANYRDRFGAAVGYLTAGPAGVKLGR
jgi:secreted PhoX family phosphatase